MIGAHLEAGLLGPGLHHRVLHEVVGLVVRCRVSDTAKARRLGSVASSSRLNDSADSLPWRSVLRLLRLSRPRSSLLQQIERSWSGTLVLTPLAVIVRAACGRYRSSAPESASARLRRRAAHVARSSCHFALCLRHLPRYPCKHDLTPVTPTSRPQMPQLQKSSTHRSELFRMPSLLRCHRPAYTSVTRETSIMTLSTRIAPHLPYLRRFSRAVTGSQTSRRRLCGRHARSPDRRHVASFPRRPTTASRSTSSSPSCSRPRPIRVPQPSLHLRLGAARRAPTSPTSRRGRARPSCWSPSKASPMTRPPRSSTSTEDEFAELLDAGLATRSRARWRPTS